MKLRKDSLFAVLMRARWWVSVLVALGVFALARLILPAGFALFATLPFIVIVFVVAWKEIRQPRGARLERALEKLRALSWEAFAAGLEDGFRRQGYTVARVQGAGDVELRKDDRVSLVSARRWKAARTGVEPLRELAAAGEKGAMAECVYVVAGDMTDQARAFAVEKRIRLLEGGELAALVKR